jgi:large subunit ribosomal protein L15
MPLIRRLPKRGFNNAAFHKTYAVVNLDALNAFDAGSTVNEQSLRAAKLVRGNVAGVKILGDGELKHALTIEADKISESARAKIEKAGGTISLRESRRPALTEPSPKEAPVAETPAKAKPAAKKTSGKSAAKKSSAKKAAPAKKRSK